ncbi:MAG: (2Fe-2S)-binding protein [Proteobacteria bacterium]|nr:(2Fe-2S)-binding protein [Pseudomonadota bacterium]
MALTGQDIADAIADGAHTASQVGERCGAGMGCGACVNYIDEMIEESGTACRGSGCRDCRRGDRSAGEKPVRLSCPRAGRAQRAA